MVPAVSFEFSHLAFEIKHLFHLVIILSRLVSNADTFPMY